MADKKPYRLDWTILISPIAVQLLVRVSIAYVAAHFIIKFW
jgi:hypothetical protein